MKRMFYGKFPTKLMFIFALFLLFSSNYFQLGASPSVASGASPDAIGFRVMPNPGHFSPLRWYQENVKVKGSPQALIVDGYAAVRDGRSVYVNAANVIDTDSNGSLDRLYTNIYVISYNQSADDATVDIFGQILIHWKFNTNLPQEQKDKIRRDTKRLADLADIKFTLANYQEAHNGNYPSLPAGSYLPGKSISTWPSWQATLGKALGATLPIDPINILGTCPADYDPTTCWNHTTKRFYDPTPNDGIFNLPLNSRAYIYTVDSINNTYKICALLESGYANISADSCYATACIPTCATANQPNCRNNVPPNSQPGVGACCGGLTCYKCNNGYTWNGNNCVAPVCTDGDGDGYNLQGGACGPVDCDDTKNFIHPGAVEVCDTFNNNCFGGIDEGCDKDGDGYCDEAIKIFNNTSMCPKTTFIANGMYGDDCNDNNAAIHPEAGCVRTYCGDSTIQNIPENDDGITETCDDGNIVSGDGCNSNCQTEP